MQKTQEDYINGLVETRAVCDNFTDPDMLMPNIDSSVMLSLETDKPKNVKPGQKEEEAPIVFTYSLYYVYYDQYTYIRGVLFQNVIIGVGAIIVALQILSGLWIALMVGGAVFLTFFELMGVCWMLNVVVGGYPLEINAVLVVNLVTSLGFGVEFCNHIGMNFLK